MDQSEVIHLIVSPEEYEDKGVWGNASPPWSFFGFWSCWSTWII